MNERADIPLTELIAKIARALNVSLQEAERIVLSALRPR
jgi:hypothetical protein